MSNATSFQRCFTGVSSRSPISVPRTAHAIRRAAAARLDRFHLCIYTRKTSQTSPSPLNKKMDGHGGRPKDGIRHPPDGIRQPFLRGQATSVGRSPSGSGSDRSCSNFPPSAPSRRTDGGKREGGAASAPAASVTSVVAQARPTARVAGREVGPHSLPRRSGFGIGGRLLLSYWHGVGGIVLHLPFTLHRALHEGRPGFWC